MLNDLETTCICFLFSLFIFSTVLSYFWFVHVFFSLHLDMSALIAQNKLNVFVSTITNNHIIIMFMNSVKIEEIIGITHEFASPRQLSISCANLAVSSAERISRFLRIDIRQVRFFSSNSALLQMIRGDRDEGHDSLGIRNIRSVTSRNQWRYISPLTNPCWETID